MKVEAFNADLRSDYLSEIQNLHVRAIEADRDGDHDMCNTILDMVDERIEALIALLPQEID